MFKNLVLILMFFSSVSSADLIKVEFTGESENLWEIYKLGNSYDIENVISSNMFGFNFEQGESINGYYIYDSSVAIYPSERIINDPNYNAYPSIIEWGYSSTNHSFSGDQTNDYLAIYNNGLSSEVDMFYGSAGHLIGQYFTSLNLSLIDSSGTLWNSLEIPKDLNLVDFNSAKFEGSFKYKDTGDKFTWTATVKELRVSNLTQVNEPSSIALFCALIFFMRRKFASRCT
jgi:hypothetical protein